MSFHFLVGTFNSPHLFTLAFTPSERKLEIVSKTECIGSHSWLSLSADRKNLYATCWTTPPTLAAYSLSPATTREGPLIKLLNTVPTAARSGYVCNSKIAAYSAGGPTGEVVAIDQNTGAFVEGEEGTLQRLDFVDQRGQKDDGGVMDFGGLRNGAHSADLSPDGKTLYIADIGRNCIFVYTVNPDGSLTLTDKNIAPRPNDGPRHAWPHPNGKIVYSLQEHTSMVDVFELNEGKLTWKQGVKIIPDCKYRLMHFHFTPNFDTLNPPSALSPTLFWADEVRLSPSTTSTPAYLFASTRGLEPSQKGWVAAYPLSPSGLISSTTPLHLYETPTSGGWANAIEPAPLAVNDAGGEGKMYAALTDSEEGLVMVLSWDGKEWEEVARVCLGEGEGAATAVWL
ncbi:carboxy-cis,cis-muconate cyclase [Pseudohyphozyma bogoriensis]|nr:carboxy-cis,cis-muconate cyclase [Pseudohyphozyma bogoriensis]